jgi:hypothetical protein
MLASRCGPPSGVSYFHSRAGSRLVAACAALGVAQTAMALGAVSSPSARRQRVALAAAAAVAGGGGRKDGRALRKGELPTKACATCGLPFEYRAKWAKVWDEVKFCSERCRRNKNDREKAPPRGGE